MSKALDPKQIKQIGHEARRPLISLIDTANVLLAGYEGDLSEQMRKDVAAMKANAEQALGAIDALVSKLKESLES